MYVLLPAVYALIWTLLTTFAFRRVRGAASLLLLTRISCGLLIVYTLIVYTAGALWERLRWSEGFLLYGLFANFLLGLGYALSVGSRVLKARRGNPTED